MDDPRTAIVRSTGHRGLHEVRSAALAVKARPLRLLEALLRSLAYVLYGAVREDIGTGKSPWVDPSGGIRGVLILVDSAHQADGVF